MTRWAEIRLKNGTRIVTNEWGDLVYSAQMKNIDEQINEHNFITGYFAPDGNDRLMPETIATTEIRQVIHIYADSVASVSVEADSEELWAVWDGPADSGERMLRMVTTDSDKAWELRGYIVSSNYLETDTDMVSVEWITNLQLRQYNYNNKSDMQIAVDDYTPKELVPILGLTLRDEE